MKVLDISPCDDSRQELQLELDPEWLCILRSTNHLLRLTKSPTFMPGPGVAERYSRATLLVEYYQVLDSFNIAVF